MLDSKVVLNVKKAKYKILFFDNNESDCREYYFIIGNVRILHYRSKGVLT